MNSSDALKFVIYIISNKNLSFCNRPQYQNPPKTNNAYALSINASFQAVTVAPSLPPSLHLSSKVFNYKQTKAKPRPRETVH